MVHCAWVHYSLQLQVRTIADLSDCVYVSSSKWPSLIHYQGTCSSWVSLSRTHANHLNSCFCRDWARDTGGRTLRSPTGEKQRWQKRWFVLKGNQMEYYKKEEDSGKEHPKGVIELQLSILARTRSECHQDIKWPKSAGEESCFGVATAKRAWYFYADDKETASWVSIRKALKPARAVYIL